MVREIFGQNKILNHLDKVKNQQDGNLETIVVSEIDMTNKCNSRCPKCIGWFGEQNKYELSSQEAFNYLCQLKDVGCRAVIFTGGGEPLMHPNTPQMLRYAKGVGLDVALITNGLIMNEQIANDINNSCTWCRVSLDAGTPLMYEITHGLPEQSFEKLKKNIKQLTDVKRKLNSNCTIGTGYLTGNETILGMRDFVRLSKDLGVDYAQLRPYHRDYTSINAFLPSLKEMETDKFKVRTSAQKYERFKDIKLRPYNRCYSGYFATVIGADAGVYWCCHTRGMDDYKLGNLREHTLREILTDREKIKQMETKIKDSVCPKLCRGDEMNRTINEINNPKEHINFL